LGDGTAPSTLAGKLQTTRRAPTRFTRAARAATCGPSWPPTATVPCHHPTATHPRPVPHTLAGTRTPTATRRPTMVRASGLCTPGVSAAASPQGTVPHRKRSACSLCGCRTGTPRAPRSDRGRCDRQPHEWCGRGRTQRGAAGYRGSRGGASSFSLALCDCLCEFLLCMIKDIHHHHAKITNENDTHGIWACVAQAGQALWVAGFA